MAYNTPETVADYLARFQMEITHRGKGTFTPDHVKYSLTIASGGKDFFTTFESNPHVHGEPTITQVFGALASDAMVVRDYGMDEFVDEFCDGMKPSAAIRAYNSCKETYDWMRDGLYLSNAISTRKRFPLTAKRTIWKTAGMGLMVTPRKRMPRKRMPRKRTIEMHSRL